MPPTTSTRKEGISQYKQRELGLEVSGSKTLLSRNCEPLNGWNIPRKFLFVITNTDKNTGKIGFLASYEIPVVNKEALVEKMCAALGRIGRIICVPDARKAALCFRAEGGKSEHR